MKVYRFNCLLPCCGVEKSKLVEILADRIFHEGGWIKVYQIDVNKKPPQPNLIWAVREVFVIDYCEGEEEDKCTTGNVTNVG